MKLLIFISMSLLVSCQSSTDQHNSSIKPEEMRISESYDKVFYRVIDSEYGVICYKTTGIDSISCVKLREENETK